MTFKAKCIKCKVRYYRSEKSKESTNKNTSKNTFKGLLEGSQVTHSKYCFGRFQNIKNFTFSRVLMVRFALSTH